MASSNIAPSRGHQFSTFETMVVARRWLLASPQKVPHYVTGAPRSGALDTPQDLEQLAGYHEACEALERCGPGWLLGFALGPDGTGGHWQGIDFDDVEENQLAKLANEAPGYVEMSPSERGAHAIGYGRQFSSLGHNGTGVEAYAGGRYFTVTQRKIRDELPTCLADFVEQRLSPRHSIGRSAPAETEVELIQVDAGTTRDLRSALFAMPSDDYQLWIRMGLALRELGNVGRGLWLEWSSTSEKFDAQQAARKWASFRPTATAYQAVFAEAQRYGWLNPGSNSAQASRSAAPSAGDGKGMLEQLSVDWTADIEVDVPDLVDGLVADEDVTLLGGHGGSGKSFLALQIACAVALGEPVLGHTTRQSRVLFYSAEDGRKRLTRRMRNLTEYFDYDDYLLRQQLQIIDASELDPLYGEITSQATDAKRTLKGLGPSAAFATLQKIVETFDPQLVIIDGASDTFDGNEIARRDVRSFIKALRRVHPNRNVGILLLVHIDRSSARGYTTNDDGYSGSGQWHNSSRRRLFLQAKIEKDDDGNAVCVGMTLRVMKNQDGAPKPDMELHRGPYGLWLQEVQFGGNLLTPPNADHGPALLELIESHYRQGNFLSTSLAPQASSGVYAVLKTDPRFPPGLKRKQTDALVRKLERDGLLVKEEYRRSNRAQGERWAVRRQ